MLFFGFLGSWAKRKRKKTKKKKKKMENGRLRLSAHGVESTCLKVTPCLEREREGGVTVHLFLSNRVQLAG